MSLFIYLISFLEGFTTLSIEIIAIRNFTPIIGTNSISTSIILGIILLALSYGYYIGGKNTRGKTAQNLRSKIILNLAIASAYYLFFTFEFDKILIETLLANTNSYFFSILVGSFLLFFVPVFYASQTIPLLSEILKGDNTGEKIGKLLFFSTIGSFFGSVGTSSVLFAIIGVSKTATLNSIILSFVAILVTIQGYNEGDKKLKFQSMLATFIFVLGMYVLIMPNNSRVFLYDKANSYHNIQIYDTVAGLRIFSQNGGFASGIILETKESYFGYIREIKSKIVNSGYKNVGIIGAAGFTLPNELSKYEQIESVEVADVDGTLRDISEKYFLEEKISDKVKFIVEPARYFINNRIEEGKKYDAIVIDIYVGKSLPPQTLTLEFFEGLTQIADDIYINLITDTSLESTFSNRLLSTMKKAFHEVYYYDTNNGMLTPKTNFVITNKEFEGYTRYINDTNIGIYTDDKNSIEIDLFEILK